jgi:hypothetical protein
MNYLLHNPYMTGLVPLIAVPLLVHLLARAKPPKYLFSATAFVIKVVQQTLRIKRPKDRLLLLCRTALFTALCLVFIRPVVFLKDRIVGRDEPRNVVLVIDRSASMAWSEGGRTRFTAACDEAAAILEGLSSRDKANIVWIDREPDAVFPEMGANIDYLRERLKTARCTNEYGHAENAVQLALSQLASDSGTRELCIISDFQVSQWKNVALTVPEDVAVATLTPTRETANNGAVLSITTVPATPLAGDTAQVMLSIGNFSNTPRNRTVILKMDEHIVTRQVQIPAWGHGAVALEHVFSKPGLVTVSARLDEDSFGVDDWRAILVPVRHGLRVGIAGEDPRTAPLFRRALHALPWVETAEIDARNIEAAQDLDLVVLAGWKGENLDALMGLKQLDLGFMVAPAPGLPMEALARLLGRQTPADTDAFRLQPLDEAMGLSLGDSSHKAFTLFRDGQFGDPSRAAFTKRLVASNLPDNGKTLLSFADRRPAVIEYVASPPVVVWLAPLSAECSDWTAQPAFLPFFGELLGAVCTRRQVALPETALPGEALSFETTAYTDGQQLIDSAGHSFPVARIDSADKGTRFVSDPIGTPGIYRLCARQDCGPVQIVNFPGAESDLRTGQPPDTAKGPLPAAKTAAALDAGRDGTALWKVFIWVVLGLIVLECLLVLLLDREENKMAQGSL